MEYRFAVRRNYEDFAAGRVLIGAAGASNFPVRLGSELFSRAARVAEEAGVSPPYRVWDPFCGTGYLLTVLGFLHRDAIERFIGCDVDPGALSIARRNLELLSMGGLEARARELEALVELYDKSSHRSALASAEHLAGLVRTNGELKEWLLLEADSTAPGGLARVASEQPNVVLADLPYGRLSEWRSEAIDPVDAMLDALAAVVSAPAVVVIVSTKGTRIDNPSYRRVERLNAGKRRVHILLREDLAEA